MKTDTNTTPTAADVDPILTNDMTDTSPNEPLFPKNDYIMEVVKIEQRHSDAKDSNYLNIQLKTVEPATSVTGEPLPAGKTFFARFSITPTPNYTAEAIKRAVKRFMICFGQPNGALAPFEQWVGKRGSVALSFSRKTPDYPDDRNEVRGFNPPR